MVWRGIRSRQRGKHAWLSNQSGAPRIPIALQGVFLSSNRGNEVNKPPPGKIAFKTFFRNLFSSKKSKTHETIDETSVQLSVGSESGANTQTSIPIAIKEIEIKKEVSPQQYLDDLLNSRGYSTETKKTLQTGYYAKPTDHQQASYDYYLTDLARAGKHALLQKILQCGVSTNPCNTHGESLIHLVSRRCDLKTLKVLLDAGASIQVSDDYGRTPLHDACWRAEPCFEMIELMANRDLRLFHLADERGSTPLGYIHHKHWDQWIDFFESKKDIWWSTDPTKKFNGTLPDLMEVAPNTSPIQDPSNALKLELCNLVASNRLKPEEAIFLNSDDDDDDDECDSDDDEYDSDDNEYDSDDDEYDSDEEYDSDDESFSCEFDPEMEEMLCRVSTSKQQLAY